MAESGDSSGTIAELMMEQVEFSNVVIINKTDLVTAEQQQDVLDRVSILNPNVKVLKSCQSRIDVMEILDTNLYSSDDLGINSVMAAASRVKAAERGTLDPEEDECCKKTLEEGREKCCKSKAKNGQELDSGISQIILGVVANNKQMTRHEERFGISSFIYRARRPFHPGRLYDIFLNPFFFFHGSLKEEAMEIANMGLESHQRIAKEKHKAREGMMGGLMRSKGFVWVATSQYFKGAWQQAGGVVRIKPAGPWLTEIRELWEEAPAKSEILKEMTQDNGEVQTIH